MSRPKALPMQDIAEKYAAGRSLQSLALTYDVAYSTIHRRLVLHGVQLRPAGGRAKPKGWRS